MKHDGAMKFQYELQVAIIRGKLLKLFHARFIALQDGDIKKIKAIRNKIKALQKEYNQLGGKDASKDNT
jgi:hypothetical protein